MKRSWLILGLFACALQAHADVPERGEQVKELLKSGDSPESALKRSLDFFATDSGTTISDLQDFWKELKKKADTEFLEKRIDAFLARSEKYKDLLTTPNKSKAVLLLDSLKKEFPRKKFRSAFDHDAYASFSLLGNLALREFNAAPQDTDWLYLTGSAFAWIRVGGDQQLEDALRQSKGKSPWAKSAFNEFQDYLDYLNRGRLSEAEKQRIQNLKSLF